MLILFELVITPIFKTMDHANKEMLGRIAGNYKIYADWFDSPPHGDEHEEF